AQGYGSGLGRGGTSGRASTRPTVRTSVTEVNGELDKHLAIRVLRRHQARVAYCYEKQLAVEPGLTGTVTLELEIGADGAVTSSRASGLNDEVASCAANTFRRAVFPPPSSSTASVTATFKLSPPPAPATP
ncbi:MAG: AgmX/PglI C-terminal domain-containing protein, partial [Deltaproteobacteria bacterium]|nr:AgmX/PglI C-terminal domain-containing protein [Kofleriaceae bacterium]